MEKMRKRFNWKARQVFKVSIDNSAQNVKTEFSDNQSYDEANPFLLPSVKRKTRIKNLRPTKVKLLSKKQRKHVEKILNQKKKKEERAALQRALASVQAPPELMPKLMSVTEIQTKGRKRMFQGNKTVFDKLDESSTDANSCNKKMKVLCRKINQSRKIEQPSRPFDPNVVGFTSSESDETGSESDIENFSTNENEEERIMIEENACPSENSSLLETNEEKMPLSENSSISECNQNQVIKENNPNQQRSNRSEKNEQNNTQRSKSSKIFVPVERSVEIQRMRSELPILSEEQAIMEAINENDVIIITGETGSGKTTQVPQFLFEAGYCLNGKMIGVTEPRRVAAISMSRRVAEEMSLSSDEVSYLIRFEGNTTPKTRIKFMTDGVLLKEMRKDFLLRKYSAIIVDEAHERNIFTDILIGCLSRVTLFRRMQLKYPLKLIIMSATIELEDYIKNPRLFKTPPPVIKLSTRQFSVTAHFNKRTPADYMKEAFQRACKIHTRLPDGGILIFLTGQNEVNCLVKKLRKAFPLPRDYKKRKISVAESEIKKEEIAEDEYGRENENCDSDFETNSKKFKLMLKKKKKASLPEICLEDYATKPADDEMEMYETDDELDEDIPEESLMTGNNFRSMWVLPLYSLLPSKEQAKVFEPPPEGCRLCVVATNVAETSITIPNVKYVIDSGRTKVKLYDKLTGISAYCVTWTSKASADQRAGRAGRTSAGHCYRLYSSAIFNDEFEKWSTPEIKVKPVDDLIMQMKALNLERVVDFPFPTSPDLLQLKVAERRLTLLGALERIYHKNDEYCSKLTPLGEVMAKFPVSPRFGKMLALSCDFSVLPYIVPIVAALSVQQFLLNANEENSKMWRTWAGTGHSLLLGDVMVLLKALGAAEYAKTSKDGLEKFCNKCGLRYKAVVEAHKLRVQLTNEINESIPNLNLTVNSKLPIPTSEHARCLRQLMLSGLGDHIAHKLTNEERKQAGLSKSKAVYRVPELDDIVYINSMSVLKKFQPEWIVYQEVYQVGDKLYARGITAIEPEWLPEFAAPFCNVSAPLKDPPPFFDEISGRVMCYVNSTFGRSGWMLPTITKEYPAGQERFQWFAQFFLEGVVCTKLKAYRYNLLNPPETIFKSWAKFLTGRVNNFLRVLINKNVDSRDKLLETWKTNSRYLLNEYLEWLPLSDHFEIRALWPPSNADK